MQTLATNKREAYRTVATHHDGNVLITNINYGDFNLLYPKEPIMTVHRRELGKIRITNFLYNVSVLDSFLYHYIFYLKFLIYIYKSAEFMLL